MTRSRMLPAFASGRLDSAPAGSATCTRMGPRAAGEQRAGRRLGCEVVGLLVRFSELLEREAGTSAATAATVGGLLLGEGGAADHGQQEGAGCDRRADCAGE